MSIFKDTLKEHIYNQIIARQALLASENRAGLNLHRYVSAKSPWVSMTSFVDYKGSQELAKQHVLYSGTSTYVEKVVNGKKVQGLQPRIGIKNSKGSYSYTEEYGPRPMSGIESVSIESKGAYGSLREAVVKFYVWSLEELETMKILYMTPFYPVLLEWGWSMYPNSNKIQGENTEVLPFSGNTINCFDGRLSIEGIYDKLFDLNKKYLGNYEGMLGFIKNFEYSLMANGGFECRTVLISMGDVISSIRMNNISGDLPEKNQESPNPDEESDYMDEFELMMTDLARLGKDYSYVSDIKRKADTLYGDRIDTRILGHSGYRRSASSSNPYGLIKEGDSRYYKYIQLGYFIHILNEKRNLFTDTADESVVKYEIPIPGISKNMGNGLCVASYNSMVVDPKTCLIFNRKADLIEGGLGYNPPMYEVRGFNESFQAQEMSMIQSGLGDLGALSFVVGKQYLYGDTNMGIIGNIYVSIGKILEVYRTKSIESKGYLTIHTFLKTLLESISYSLGSSNSFDLYSNDNRLVFIDKYYLEDPANAQYNNKKIINIIGNNTTVREQKTMSKIFQEQATMIAIAAQDRENIASLHTSTVVAMNKGLTNRLFKKISDSKPSSKDTNEKDQKLRILDAIIDLVAYQKEYVLSNDVKGTPADIIPTMNNYLNSLVVRIEGGTDFKGIVPLSLEIKMDGIGGITIGEIFRIDAKYLPKEYRDKHVGFIVTGISQEITRPDWTTTLKTQFCLLDQIDKQKETKRKADALLVDFKKRKAFNINTVKVSLYNYNLLMYFVKDVFEDMLMKGIQNDRIYFISGKNQNTAVFKELKERSIDFLTGMGKYTDLGNSVKAFNTRAGISNPVLMSTYLNTNLFAVIDGVSVFTQEGYKENVIKYLDFVIKESSYFKDMIPALQDEFLKELKSIFVIYMNKNAPTSNIFNSITPIRPEEGVDLNNPNRSPNAYYYVVKNVEAYNKEGKLDFDRRSWKTNTVLEIKPSEHFEIRIQTQDYNQQTQEIINQAQERF